VFFNIGRVERGSIHRLAIKSATTGSADPYCASQNDEDECDDTDYCKYPAFKWFILKE